MSILPRLPRNDESRRLLGLATQPMPPTLMEFDYQRSTVKFTPTEELAAWDRTSETEPLDQPPIAARILAQIGRSNAIPALAGFLIAFACFALGWWLRSAFPNDYTSLAWLVPLVTFYVAWGNRRAA